MPRSTLTFSSTRVPPARRARRVAVVCLGALAVAVLLWACALALVWGHASLQLGADEIPALQEDLEELGAAGTTAPQDATTLLVTMTGPVDPTVPRPAELAGPVVLVQVGAAREEPAALTLPGDLVVTVEGEGDLSLEEVQAAGGTDLLVRAVADYSEVRIDHAVSLSIDALPELVEAAAPVEVCGPDGCSVPTGEQLREALVAADGQPLVELVAAVGQGLGERIDGRFVVGSPLQTKRVVDAVADEVHTDVGLGGTRLLDIAGMLAATSALDADSVPLLVNPETGELVPLLEPAMVRFQHLREGTPLRETAREGGSADLEADIVGNVEVAVLNGAGVDGLAAQVQVDVETAGFQVVGTGNAPSFDRTDTVVHYITDDPTVAFAAAQLSEALGGAVLEPLGQRPEFEGREVDLLVTVGEDRAD